LTDKAKVSHVPDYQFCACVTRRGHPLPSGTCTPPSYNPPSLVFLIVPRIFPFPSEPTYSLLALPVLSFPFPTVFPLLGCFSFFSSLVRCYFAYAVSLISSSRFPFGLLIDSFDTGRGRILTPPPPPQTPPPPPPPPTPPTPPPHPHPWDGRTPVSLLPSCGPFKFPFLPALPKPCVQFTCAPSFRREAYDCHSASGPAGWWTKLFLHIAFLTSEISLLFGPLCKRESFSLSPQEGVCCSYCYSC